MNNRNIRKRQKKLDKFRPPNRKCEKVILRFFCAEEPKENNENCAKQKVSKSIKANEIELKEEIINKWKNENP